MATSIFFQGRIISVPGVYSRVDASGLESVGLGASGIVAVLGTGEGGKPAGDITEFADIPRFNSPDKMKKAFRSGPLKEVADMLFAPAKDPDIPAGAQEVLALKTNPSTQSTAQLKASGVAQIDLESADYGVATGQVNVDLQSGTTKGKLLTIKFEDVVESVDDLGGDAIFTLQYVPGSYGYNTARTTVNAAGDITVTATRAGAGLATDITTPATANAVEIAGVAGDVGVAVTIYGLVGGLPVKETLTHAGASTVTGTTVWDVGGVLGVSTSAALAGAMTVKNAPGGTTIFTVSTGQLSKGVILCQACFVEKAALSLALEAAGAHDLLVFGKDQSGSVLKEKVTTNGATPVLTTATTWSQIDVLVVGNLPVGRTLTVTVTAAKTLGAVQDKLSKLPTYFDAKQLIVGLNVYGFVFAYGTGKTSFLTKDLDIVSGSGTNILSPATGTFTADLYAIIAWINQNSVLVTATESTGATVVPDNTSAPIFLTGGIEGTALFSHYQAALNLLKKGRVNSIVDLSGDPAVAAALDAHCAYMGGIGRSERDGFVGLLNAGMTDVPSKTEARAQIIDINSRHIRAWGQAISRYDSNGDKVEFLPPYGAAILAGMQAGSPVGTSLTYKYLNALALRQHSSWNPTDDAEEMVQAGLVFAQNIDGVGRRVVRNLTTHLSSDNVAFVEGSVNNAVNFAVFNFRNALEIAVGKRGFAGTLAATRGVAVGVLGKMVDEGIITSYRSLTLELVVDVLDVSVEIAPVIPINFVRTTVHLVNNAQAA